MAKFVVPGDPVAGEGWYEGPGYPGGEVPADRRYLTTSGPITMAPGDTQEVEIAIFMAIGEDHIDSITKLKETAREIHQFSGNDILSTVEEKKLHNPKTFLLHQNYPNPFNPKTIINYELPITNEVDLSIYNLLGQKVANLVSEKQSAGHHTFEWDASRFSSGIYYYRIEAGEFQDVKKMVLLR